MKLTLIFAWMVIATAATLQAQQLNPTKVSSPGEARKEKIRKMMALSGGEQAMTNMLGQIVLQLKQSIPEVSDEFWRDFQSELKYSNLVELCVPIYERHFTEQDLDELIKFYASPLGKKLLAKMPQINQETFAVSSAWGREIGERVQGRLKAQSSTPPSVARSQQEKRAEAATKESNVLTSEQRRLLLVQRGYDFHTYGLDDYGNVYKLVNDAPAQAQDRNSSPSPRITLPDNVRFLIQVPNGGRTYYSEKEPKPFGSGYKFVAWPYQTETIINGNVVITKVGKD